MRHGVDAYKCRTHVPKVTQGFRRSLFGTKYHNGTDKMAHGDALFRTQNNLFGKSTGVARMICFVVPEDASS